MVDLEGDPAYEIIPSTDPLTFGLLLRRTTLAKGRQEISVSDQIIRKMAVEPAGTDSVQIFLSLIKPGRASVFTLKPYQDKPDRLVIDVYRPDLEEGDKAERKGSQELKAKKNRIVVIDPGHGGEDPGAIGLNGTREKEVVLAVARKLQKVLDETGEFKAYLTRRGDYLSLCLSGANRHGIRGGLFISLHANANTSRSVRGTSVYFLSRKEPAIRRPSFWRKRKMPRTSWAEPRPAPSARISIDFVRSGIDPYDQREPAIRGDHAGGTPSDQRRAHAPSPAGGIRGSSSPEFPSILVELAYVTHPVEEKNLKQDKFQSEAAQAITSGVKRFMPVLAVKEGENNSDPKKLKGVPKGG